MEQLRMHGRIDFDTPLSEADPRLSTAELYGYVRGEMFGILLCHDSAGVEVVLKAFSCQHNGVWSVSGWAPPLVDVVQYAQIMGDGAVEIRRMSEELTHLDSRSRAWQLLRGERKRLSRGIMVELHALYRLHNFRGESTTLFHLFGKESGIPTGTGDCCAPKLLNEAALRGLTPLSLVEFFWGKENLSATRQEGVFYPPCEDKCGPILGFLLCGGTKDYD